MDSETEVALILPQAWPEVFVKLIVISVIKDSSGRDILCTLEDCIFEVYFLGCRPKEPYIDCLELL